MKRGDDPYRPRSSYNRVKKFRSLKAAADEIPESTDDPHTENFEPFEDNSLQRSPTSLEESSEPEHREPGPPESEGSEAEPSLEEYFFDSVSVPEENTDSDLRLHDNQSGQEDTDSYYSYDSLSEVSDSETTDNSDSDDEVYQDPVEDLKSKLRLWSVRNRITLKAVSHLLVLLLAWLTSYCPPLRNRLRNFPKDARTLLHTTSQNYNLREMMSQCVTLEKFVYFGLREKLKMQVKRKYFPTSEIFLDVNVDGIPLFKSSSHGFWVILCKIPVYHTVYDWAPFPVGIFSGPGKPANVEEFLEDFVSEATDLCTNNITIDGHQYKVKIRCYICDTPARSFLKKVVGHGGFYACERCTVVGETVNKRRVYAHRNCSLRTEESFIAKEQEEHPVGTTPLLQIPGFQPVSSFILDYMHLICLGIMRRLLNFYWVSKKKLKNISFPPRQVLFLSRMLNELSKYVPNEFPRKLRGLQDIRLQNSGSFFSTQDQ